jgi:hypothetical protein
MGNTKPFTLSKLFIGLIYSNEANVNLVKNDITETFGKADFESDALNFHHTNYYETEMGSSLNKCFISIEKLWNPEDIFKAKILSQEIENKYKKDNKRLVNLDPGTLTQHNIILLSTKNFTHRIPLQQGIYAELTLVYNKNEKKYLSLPWTYPDYQTSGYQNALLAIRSIYGQQIAK